jgi:hypothetical protein
MPADDPPAGALFEFCAKAMVPMLSANTRVRIKLMIFFTVSVLLLSSRRGAVGGA